MRPAVRQTEPARPNGFSLVEMLVVLLVMGLLATVAVMTIPGDERRLRDEAERFAARTLAARDEAIVGAAPVSLVVGAAGYYFERRVEGRWQPIAGGRFDQTGWGEGTVAAPAGPAAPAAGAAGAAAPAGRSRIVFDTLGLASSDAAVRLTRGSRTLTVSIARDGRVTLHDG